MNSLFFKFTSQKPEIRYHATSNSSHPLWYKLSGNDGASLIKMKELFQSPDYKKKLRMSVDRANTLGVNSFIYNYNDSTSVEYTIAPWLPLTAKNSFPVKIDGNSFPIKIDGDRLPLEGRLNKKIGLTDVFRKKERIQSFKFTDALNYAYIRDLRFIIILSIIFWFTLWGYFTPVPLNEYPFAWTSPDLQFLKKVVSDTYQGHVCSTHPTVSSPCPCGEPLNQTARDLLPLNSFDPLQINKKTQVFSQTTCSIMIGTIILVLALTESVSPHGVYIEL